MKLNFWQQSVTAGLLVFLGMSTPAYSGTVSQQSETQNLLAQATCRRVKVGTNLNIRATPNGTILNNIPEGTVVTIDGTVADGWVKIISPINGVVFAQYLTTCDQPISANTPKPVDSNCRVVGANDGVLVRQSPNDNSGLMGRLLNNQKVMLGNTSTSDGWVSISYPINGFVPAAKLKVCS
jgi:uncharacterized protein YgiM (DUF1202 family)